MKNKLLAYSISFAAFSSTALVAFAENKTFKDIINNVFINGLIRPLVPLLIGLAVVVFVYGVLLLTLSEGGDKKKEGKEFMFWGIIGIFVMVSVWGLVNILKETFSLPSNVINFQI